jgi:hypothetical protein
MKYVRCGNKLIPVGQNPKKSAGSPAMLVAGLAMIGIAVGVGYWYHYKPSGTPSSGSPGSPPLPTLGTPLPTLGQDTTTSTLPPPPPCTNWVGGCGGHTTDLAKAVGRSRITLMSV